VAALPPAAVRLNVPVTQIKTTGVIEPFTVSTPHTTFAARSIVLATPAYATADLVRDIDPDLARLCAEIPYASAATVALGFARAAVAHPLDGSGFVVPRVERTGILAASWLSSKWPHRAPDDRVLLRAFVGGARDPWALSDSDDELIDRSLRALTPLIGIRGEPQLARVYRFDRANA